MSASAESEQGQWNGKGDVPFGPTFTSLPLSPSIKTEAERYPPPGKLKEKGECFMKVKPLADRILAKRLDPEETVKGGIIIPDTAKEKPLEAKVIAVGPGKVDDNGKRIPMEVKKGQRILIGKYSGTDVKIEGEEHIILREDDVLGIVEQ